MKNKKITIIDETLREGMQYRGVMFSLDQRLKILDFQEKLGIDICQAGYPPAHNLETDAVRTLFDHARKKAYKIRIAAMGRATVHDAAILLDTRVKDLHFHIHISNTIEKGRLNNVLATLLKTIEFVRKQRSDAVISIAMLDIGRSADPVLEHCSLFLAHHHIDMLSLPDTSGMMSPNTIFEKIKQVSTKTGQTKLSVHCHNDMGMASANSVMGILAGGRVLEASALGIGERNGIADLYTTAKTLRDQGFSMNLNTNDINTFKAYYTYVDAIIFEQTCDHLLTFNTPFFGDSTSTHVAGTHAGKGYGLASGEQFFLNILCGKHLVQKYLDSHNLFCSSTLLDLLTVKIKKKSAHLNRCLTEKDIKDLISSL